MRLWIETQLTACMLLIHVILLVSDNVLSTCTVHSCVKPSPTTIQNTFCQLGVALNVK